MLFSTKMKKETVILFIYHLTSDGRMASMEYFDAMSVQMLKDFLSVRGLATSGKKKVELVALAYSSVILNIPIQATQVDLARDLKRDYDACLLKAGLTLDPNDIPTENKVDNLMWWPKINLGNIFEYILSLRDYTIRITCVYITLVRFELKFPSSASPREISTQTVLRRRSIGVFVHADVLE